VSLSVLAAPDKFRDTATAAEIAAAICAGATRAGWQSVALPLSDGGEGLLEVVGGEAHFAEVTGPLGAPVLAEWRMLGGAPTRRGPVAVIEMARASGLGVAGGAFENDPLAATTRGTGELIAAAVDAGAATVVVGCGGSASTDGGSGALVGLGSPRILEAVDLLVASDVTSRFLEAARLFGPQKGASLAQVATLERRLEALRERYLAKARVDVDRIPGSGAAGGLAGGLAAVGGKVVSGFALVSELVSLDARIEAADLVVTGEGRLDPSSFSGKVVGGVLRASTGRAPVLCVAGEVAGATSTEALEVVCLVDMVGPLRSRLDVRGLVEDVVAARLSREVESYRARRAQSTTSPRAERSSQKRG